MTRQLEFPDGFRLGDGTAVNHPAGLADLIRTRPSLSAEIAGRLEDGDIVRWLRHTGFEEMASRAEALQRSDGAQPETLAALANLLEQGGAAAAAMAPPPAGGPERSGSVGAPGPAAQRVGDPRHASELVERQRAALSAVAAAIAEGERRQQALREARETAQKAAQNAPALGRAKIVETREASSTAIRDVRIALAGRQLDNLLSGPCPVELPESGDPHVELHRLAQQLRGAPAQMGELLRQWEKARADEEQFHATATKIVIAVLLLGVLAMFAVPQWNKLSQPAASTSGGSMAATTMKSTAPVAPAGSLESLAGHWVGSASDLSAVMLIRASDGGYIAELHYAAGSETLRLSGSNGKFAFQGVSGGYRCANWPGKFPLDTIQAALSTDGNTLQGAWKDEAGDSGSWRMTRVAPSPVNLSGAWSGTYHQTGVGSVTYSANLVTFGSRLVGCSVERLPSGEQHLATLVGTMEARSVSWTKTYRKEHGALAPIEYRGTIDASGKTISGTWRIRETSGGFSMQRGK